MWAANIAQSRAIGSMVMHQGKPKKLGTASAIERPKFDIPKIVVTDCDSDSAPTSRAAARDEWPRHIGTPPAKGGLRVGDEAARRCPVISEGEWFRSKLSLEDDDDDDDDDTAAEATSWDGTCIVNPGRDGKLRGQKRASLCDRVREKTARIVAKLQKCKLGRIDDHEHDDEAGLVPETKAEDESGEERGRSLSARCEAHCLCSRTIRDSLSLARDSLPSSLQRGARARASRRAAVKRRIGKVCRGRWREGLRAPMRMSPRRSADGSIQHMCALWVEDGCK